MKKRQMTVWAICCLTVLMAGCAQGKAPAGGEAQKSSAAESSAVESSAAESSVAESTAAVSSVAESNAAESNAASSAAESATAESTAAESTMAGSTAAASTAAPNLPAASTAAEQTAVPAELPDVFPMELIFSSGAGAWQTALTLNRDGSFSGTYKDSDMGDGAEDYPNGTAYICDFSGKFGDIKQVDSCTYSMELSELTAQKPEGEEWIEDGVRYIASAPYGLEGGKDFLFYTPETELEGLSGEFLSWWPGWLYADALGKDPTALTGYGLYNREMGYGFFTYELD